MKKLTAALGLATLALAGCGQSQQQDNTATDPTETTTTAPTPLTQEEWAKMCLPDGTDPDSPRCTEDQGAAAEPLSEWDGTQGEWTLYRTIDSESVLHDWSIRIDSAEVTDSIDEAADNPDYMGGDLDAPERIAAEAQDGTELFHAVFTARNDGVAPDMLPALYMIHFSDGEIFAPTGDDDTYRYNLTIDRDPAAGSSTQNPGSEAQGDIVIEIPANSEIAAVEFCDPYIESDFCTTIELTEITR